jgi:acetyl-CoA carboxylase carboxyl transferase subunit beta
MVLPNQKNKDFKNLPNTAAGSSNTFNSGKSVIIRLFTVDWCPYCKKALHYQEQVDNLHVCQYCNHHLRIVSREYFELLFDNNDFKELFGNLTSGDPLNFTDSKKYTERIAETTKKTGLKDAIRAAHGKIEGQDLVVACMDFAFIGGSMGSVVGEKIARSIDYCIKNKIPFLYNLK